MAQCLTSPYVCSMDPFVSHVNWKTDALFCKIMLLFFVFTNMIWFYDLFIKCCCQLRWWVTVPWIRAKGIFFGKRIQYALLRTKVKQNKFGSVFIEGMGNSSLVFINIGRSEHTYVRGHRSASTTQGYASLQWETIITFLLWINTW